MIKPSELRIGNMVGHQDPDYAEHDDEIHFIGRVFSIDERSVVIKDALVGGTVQSFAELIPVPITPHNLKQMGFIDHANNGWGLRLYLNDSDELAWYLQDQQMYGEARIKYQTRGTGFARDFKIRYVHQLQNLFFALTGEELTVKEMA